MKVGEIVVTGKYEKSLVCDGRAVSEGEYFTLSTVIRRTYDRGDELDGTFRLPKIDGFSIVYETDEVEPPVHVYKGNPM